MLNIDLSFFIVEYLEIWVAQSHRQDVCVGQYYLVYTQLQRLPNKIQIPEAQRKKQNQIKQSLVTLQSTQIIYHPLLLDNPPPLLSKTISTHPMKNTPSPRQPPETFSPSRPKPRVSESPVPMPYPPPDRPINPDNNSTRRPRPSQLSNDPDASMQSSKWQPEPKTSSSPNIFDLKAKLAQFAQKHEEISQKLIMNRTQAQGTLNMGVNSGFIGNRVASPQQKMSSANNLYQMMPNKDIQNFSSTGNLPRNFPPQSGFVPPMGQMRTPQMTNSQMYHPSQSNPNNPFSHHPKRQPRASEPVFENNFSQDEFDPNLPEKSLRLQPSKHSRSPQMARYQPGPSTQPFAPQPTSQTSIKQNFLPKQDAFKKPGALKETISTYYTNNSKQSSIRATENKSGFQLSDFKIGKELGSGKFGSVFIVQHKLTGFICAMKRIPKQSVREEHIMNQLIREIKIQSALDHPNIVKLYGFFHDQENVYLLLELGSSGQLYHVIKKKVRLAQSSVAYAIKQVCEAIRYLHFFKIIHRDLKPENIVIQSGTVKLCDFGWAVIRGSELRSTFCGTPLYVSPQILKGHCYDERIDLWGIGVLTYELLVGNIPFDINCEQELIKIIKEDVIFPTDIPISDVAKDFILRILKKNPEDRIKIAELLQHEFLSKIPELAPQLEEV